MKLFVILYGRGRNRPAGFAVGIYSLRSQRVPESWSDAAATARPVF